MSGTTPAGWYSDGTTPNQERFWDGAQWSDQFRPVAPQYQPAPPRPGSLGISLKQSLRGASLLFRGYAENAIDEALTTEQRGGRKLVVWLAPVALNAILVGFWFIAFVASPVGILRETVSSALGSLGETFGSLGGTLGGSLGGSLGGLINTSAMAGILAAAFFIGLAVGALFFVLRALAIVLTARARGGRVGFVDSLIIVGTAHSLTPVAWVLATVFLAIPGYTGLILFAIVQLFIGLPLLILAENAIYLGSHRATSFSRAPLFASALFGGLAIALVYTISTLIGWGLMMAALDAVVGGVPNGVLGGLSGLFG